MVGMRNMYAAVMGVSLAVAGSVASATTVSLISGAGSQGTLNSAIFKWTDIDGQSAGTGAIDPFLRIQADPSEKGYNSGLLPGSNRTVQFDETTNAGNNHILDISATSGDYDVPKFTIGSTVYREFLLDVNEDKGSDGELIDLTVLRLYLSDNPALITLAAIQAGPLVYDMGVGNMVTLDASLNPGSGKGDMFVYIPESLFQSALTPDSTKRYLYVYSEFGRTSGGPEEWAVGTGGAIGGPTPVVPLPGALAGGAALFGIMMARRVLRRRGNADA